MKTIEKYYIDFDNDGRLCGRYLLSMHEKNIPKTAVEVEKVLFEQTITENECAWVKKPDGSIVRVQE